MMMMMDDSTISHERQIDCLNMKQLENQFCLIYFPRSHPTLMRKYVAEQILETVWRHVDLSGNLFFGC